MRSRHERDDAQEQPCEESAQRRTLDRQHGVAARGAGGSGDALRLLVLPAEQEGVLFGRELRGRA